MASSEKRCLFDEGFEFIQVKKSKIRKKQQNQMKEIALTNRYEGLVDEPVDLSNLEDAPEPEKSNDKNRKLKKIRNRKKRGS